MDTDSFIIHLRTEDIYKHIPKDVEKIFETLNIELDRPLPKEKIKISNSINERWNRWTNDERVLWIKSKSI